MGTFVHVLLLLRVLVASSSRLLTEEVFRGYCQVGWHCAGKHSRGSACSSWACTSSGEYGIRVEQNGGSGAFKVGVKENGVLTKVARREGMSPQIVPHKNKIDFNFRCVRCCCCLVFSSSLCTPSTPLFAKGVHWMKATDYMLG